MMNASKRAKGELVYLSSLRGTSESISPGPKTAEPDRGGPEEATGLHRGRRFAASVTLLRNELYVEIPDAEAMELVDRALLAALLEGGVGAGKEGPHVATAVAPPTCYGKVRIATRDEDFVRRHLEAARRAALVVLRENRCLITERR